MENNPIHLQEILFGSSDKKVSRQLSIYVKEGLAKKIAPRLYTTNLTDSPENIIRRNWFRVLAQQYPGAVLSHRSALEGRPSQTGDIFLTYTYTKNIEMPGLTIHFQKGAGALNDDKSFFGELYMAQEARAYLENLQSSKSRGGIVKTLTREQLEQRLEAVIRVRGEEGINELRDQARTIAVELNMESEFGAFNTLVSALLSTQPAKLLSSAVAKARALGEPFDPARITIFETLYEALAGQEFPIYKNQNVSDKSYQNFSFFESYFSNYIEGTVFEIEEAKQIILTETPIPARNEDSHDVLGTYKLVSNRQEMSICPKSPDDLLHILRYRHKILMSARTDKNPGQFKDRNNRAGNTQFVDWTLVAGTLKKGYEWYSILQHPFAKSVYMMFMVSEVHPFLDGNGRIARVMMNAELSSQGLSKIMIPTVYREDYMGALRVLTRQTNPDPYIRMLLRIYSFSATVKGEDINEMERYLKSCNTFAEPEEGKLMYQPL